MHNTAEILGSLAAEINILGRQLKLSNHFTERCLSEGTPEQLVFIRDRLQEDVELRAENKLNRLLKRAGFPVFKTFDGYETDKVRLPEQLTFDTIRACSFMQERTNLILFGPVGVGKTHMAVAIGVEACRLGHSVRFFTVAGLVRFLSESSRSGKLQSVLKSLNQADLLILDEWGYVPVDKEGSRLLFQVIADRHETKSMIITTNLEFSRWGSVLTDEQMAAAIIDRLVHFGYLISFKGESYRVEHSLMRRVRKTGAN